MMVQNRWNEADEPSSDDLLASRVYSSRLLGADPALVLHGGGNTSVKLCRQDVFAQSEDLLLVKGSGWDLASIEAAGFVPLLLDPVRRLSELESLTDIDMARQLNRYKVDPGAPSPSVEAILHAVLPFRFVDHTHADAIVTLTNTVHGEGLVREVFGTKVLVVPYVMPGFDLARHVAQALRDWNPETEAMILMNHGVFTFGETARESYERMIAIVSEAERAVPLSENDQISHLASPHGSERRNQIAALRHEVSAAARSSFVLSVTDDAASLSFARRHDVRDVARRGPATPDHVIRTKATPLVGRDVASFVADYERYFAAHSATARTPVQMLDPAPRVILDSELGLITAGRTVADASIASDIYRHTIAVIAGAESLGGYQSLSEQDLFDVEYWDLEQAKLTLAGVPRPLAGQVALVTGAASGIGRAVSQSLLDQGVAVVGFDINPDVLSAFDSVAWRGVVGDVSDVDSVSSALDEAALSFGGLDVLVVNAGVFPQATPVTHLTSEAFRNVLHVNLDSAVDLLREAHPLLKLSFVGGRVVVVGSKNVAAPGPGVAAYSASKAALTQLARVLALEWAPDNIRVNVVHPDAVFDTGIWTADVLQTRAEHYGMSVEDYRRRNLLSTEVTSQDVAAIVLAMIGPAFAKTTGAQVPVDGGNDRVI